MIPRTGKRQQGSLNKLQQLMVITMEECSELTQVCSKTIRKYDTIEEATSLYAKENHDKLVEEAGDVLCRIQLMVTNGLLTMDELNIRVEFKKDKLKKMERLSMKSFGCYFGQHSLEVVAVNNQYHTSYADTGRIVYHTMRFYQCKHCEHRVFKTNFKSYGSSHTGIDICKENWLDVGTVPASSYDPRQTGYKPTPTPPVQKSATVLPFEVIKGDKK